MLNNLELALGIEILQSLKTLKKVRLKYRMFCGLKICRSYRGKTDSEPSDSVKLQETLIKIQLISHQQFKSQV